MNHSCYPNCVVSYHHRRRSPSSRAAVVVADDGGGGGGDGGGGGGGDGEEGGAPGGWIQEFRCARRVSAGEELCHAYVDASSPPGKGGGHNLLPTHTHHIYGASTRLLLASLYSPVFGEGKYPYTACFNTSGGVNPVHHHQYIEKKVFTHRYRSLSLVYEYLPSPPRPPPSPRFKPHVEAANT